MVPLVKNPPANAGDSGDLGSIFESGRSLGVGNGNPGQYCCFENFMDKGSLVDYSPWGRKESDPTEHTYACDYLRGLYYPRATSRWPLPQLE